MTEPTPGRPEWHPPLRAAVFVAAAIYACLVGVVLLDPKGDAVAPKVVGPNPLGLPARWVIAGLLTAWYAPFGWVFYHALALANAARVARRMFGFGLLVAALRSGDPDARRSALVTLG